MNNGSCRKTRVLVLLALLVAAAGAQAQARDVYVPDELRPWQAWVLHGKDYLECPFFFNRQPSDPDSFICAWPGELEITVAGNGGRFGQTWSVAGSAQWVPLPGSAENWPEEVTSDGRIIEVVMRDRAPWVRLAPGRHTLAGRFTWEQRPRTLAVPRATGLLRLTVDGNRVARPELNGNALWLGQREAEPAAADALAVHVHRVVVDDVPTRLATRFTLEVSGSMREELLAPALPDGFVPLSLESPLPARFEPGGELRLQVRPGTWVVQLAARAESVREEIALPEPVRNLPDSEIWSYSRNDALRVTAPEGLPPVDPQQVSVPAEYLALPAFRITPGEALSIVERSRGKVAFDNQLRLERRLWLDFEDGGLTFSDSLTGLMQSGWRLDMAAPYALLSASQAGAELLVTLGPEDGRTGVELRQPAVDLHAVGRASTRGAIPVSGWQARLEGVTTELNLPPGHKLLAAVGAERAPLAWVERWQLPDFFLVLVITLAAGRMFGPAAGAVAFAALLLSWHESGAPRWAWLNLLAAAALVRVTPPGRLLAAARVYRGASLAALLILLVPFVAGQLRLALYPQLEPQQQQLAVTVQQPPPVAAAAEAARDLAMPAELLRPSKLKEELAATGSGLSRFARYAPNAILQAGPGRPAWSWNSYKLYWSGPVDPQHTVQLVILPRWAVTLLRVAAVLLLLLTGALFVFETLDIERRWPPRRGAARTPPAASLLLVLGGALAVAGLAAAPAAFAETPSPELLRQLEQRLLEPPPCVPRCAEIVAGSVSVEPDAMTVELVVHALQDVAVPLPGSLPGWRPESVRVDGTPAPSVFRGGDQALWLALAPGTHRIALEGPLPPVDSLEIPFPAPPRVVVGEASGWVLSGIEDRRLLAGSLRLTRLRDGADAEAGSRFESSRFPEFVLIEREIELDLDWRVHTRVTRIAPERGAIALSVPLLPGASLLTAGLPVSDGEVRVSLDPAQQSAEWTATLPRTPTLVLRVAGDAPWKEVWRFAIGNTWHAQFSGVPESETAPAAGAVRVAEFHPRGGESLTLAATRPEASGGTSLAFDAVSLVTEVGARSRSTVMTLDYRSTRGAQHVVSLPDGAEVTQVSIDGRIEPLRANDSALGLPILPGEHRVEIRWRKDKGAGAITRTPAADTGAPAGNITLGLEMPHDRWLLATSGPALGPAVMYWPELAALLLFAFLLGRVPVTPLKTHHWLLLGLGFSTFSWPVLALVALWLLATGARLRWQMPEDVHPWRYNAAQVAFAALALTALVAIVVSVPSGLLGSPEMHIAGNGSHGNSLRWFADRGAGALPAASVFSLPLWVYKVLILAWALWFSFALLRWLPWTWRSFTIQGPWRTRAPTQGQPGGAPTT